MANVLNIFEEVILEKKTETLKVFYDIDVLIQDYKDSVEKEEEEGEEEGEEAAPEGEETAPEGEEDAPEGEEDAPEEEEDTAGAFESTRSKKGYKYLAENIYRQETNGEVVVQKKDVDNIQTFQDLIEFLARTDKSDQSKDQTPIEKILNKKGSLSKEEELTSQKIISPIIREAVLLLIGAGGKGTEDLISEDDRVIIDIDYGHSKKDCIGFKITKNPGTEVFSTVIKKDGEILSSKFDINIINKQLLYYRNSVQ